MSSSAGLLVIAPSTVRPEDLLVSVVECSTSLGFLEISAPWGGSPDWLAPC